MKRLVRWPVSLMGLVLCATPARAQATVGGDWREDVSAYARRIVAAGLTPGMAVAVSQGDQVVFSQGFGLAAASTGRPREFTLPLLLRLLAGYGPGPEGTAFNHDNLPCNILGMALDPRQEEGWKEVVRREVLEPAGMTGTSARVPTLLPGRVARPHASVPGAGWHRTPLGKAGANRHAAGGVVVGRRVFPRAAIESTHEKHADQDRDCGPIHRFGWGYGRDPGTWQGRTIVHRFGGFTGYHSHASFEPESQVGVVVLVNGDGPAPPAADLVAMYVHDCLPGRADVSVAAKGQLRVELLGSGRVVTFEFPAGGGPAAALTMDGDRFARVDQAR